MKSIANGPFPIDNIRTLASLKLDHSFNGSNSVAFRYIFGQARSAGDSAGGLTDQSGGSGERQRDQSFLGTFTHIFSPSVLSETRYQYAPRKLEQTANDPIGPRVSISGTATFGRNTSYPVLLDEGRHQMQQSVSYQRGRHFFKFGTEISRLLAHTSFPSTFGGTFSFSSLADFQAGRVNSFSQGFGDPEIRLPDTLYGRLRAGFLPRQREAHAGLRGALRLRRAAAGHPARPQQPDRSAACRTASTATPTTWPRASDSPTTRTARARP